MKTIFQTLNIVLIMANDSQVRVAELVNGEREVDSDAIVATEQKGVDSAIGNRITFPANVDIDSEEVAQFQGLGYTYAKNNMHILTLPKGWKSKRDPRDNRNTLHVDGDGKVRVEVWLKSSSYDPYIRISFCKDGKTYKQIVNAQKDDPLKLFENAINGLNATYRATHGHSMAYTYLIKAYEKVVKAYNELPPLVRAQVNLPAKPQESELRNRFW